MVKATELRIGNVIRFADRKHTYSIDCAEDLVMVENNEEAYEGIPLTPEMIERAGFVKGEWYKNWAFNGYSIQFVEGGWNFSNDASSAYCYILTEIQYLHQLQNLYFALTGEELKIELS